MKNNFNLNIFETVWLFEPPKFFKLKSNFFQKSISVSFQLKSIIIEKRRKHVLSTHNGYKLTFFPIRDA